MYLDENGTIEIKMTFNIYSGIATINADCTNLTLTLCRKGGIDGCNGKNFLK